jgi:hypothetical protein
MGHLPPSFKEEEEEKTELATIHHGVSAVKGQNGKKGETNLSISPSFYYVSQCIERRTTTSSPNPPGPVLLSPFWVYL